MPKPVLNSPEEEGECTCTPQVWLCCDDCHFGCWKCDEGLLEEIPYEAFQEKGIDTEDWHVVFHHEDCWYGKKLL